MLLTKQTLEQGGVSVAGKGSTALGVIGTVLGGLGIANTMTGCNGNGTGLLGNLFGGNCHEDCYVSRYELAQSERIAALESVIADQNAKMYSDKGDLGVYTYVVNSDKESTARINGLFTQTFDAIAKLDTAEKVNKMEIDKNLQLVNQKIDYENKLIDCKINNVLTYVTSNYIPAVKKVNLCDICPLPQVAEAVQPVANCNN